MATPCQTPLLACHRTPMVNAAPRFSGVLHNGFAYSTGCTQASRALGLPRMRFSVQSKIYEVEARVDAVIYEGSL